jgi:hypothetical protein
MRPFQFYILHVLFGHGSHRLINALNGAIGHGRSSNPRGLRSAIIAQLMKVHTDKLVGMLPLLLLQLLLLLLQWLAFELLLTLNHQANAGVFPA